MLVLSSYGISMLRRKKKDWPPLRTVKSARVVIQLSATPISPSDPRKQSNLLKSLTIDMVNTPDVASSGAANVAVDARSKELSYTRSTFSKRIQRSRKRANLTTSIGRIWATATSTEWSWSPATGSLRLLWSPSRSLSSFGSSKKLSNSKKSLILMWPVQQIQDQRPSKKQLGWICNKIQRLESVSCTAIALSNSSKVVLACEV